MGIYYVIKDESWLPWYMGGDGLVNSGIEAVPFTLMNPTIYTFGLVLLGYPVQQVITHFLIEERTPDFAEMSLHHLTHLCLSSGYLFTNTLPYGSIIAFLHDFSDLPVGVSKGLHLSGYGMPWAVIVFLLGQVFWFSMRICFLPLVIWDIHNYQTQHL